MESESISNGTNAEEESFFLLNDDNHPDKTLNLPPDDDENEDTRSELRFDEGILK